MATQPKVSKAEAEKIRKERRAYRSRAHIPHDRKPPNTAPLTPEVKKQLAALEKEQKAAARQADKE